MTSDKRIAAVTIKNQRGLHARAAAKFVQLAEQFSASISVTHKDQSVCGRSMLELLMLAATPGSRIEIAATGSDAAEAIAKLAALVESKFGEE